MVVTEINSSETMKMVVVSPWPKCFAYGTFLLIAGIGYFGFLTTLGLLSSGVENNTQTRAAIKHVHSVLEEFVTLDKVHPLQDDNCNISLATQDIELVSPVNITLEYIFMKTKKGKHFARVVYLKNTTLSFKKLSSTKYALYGIIDEEAFCYFI